MIISKRNGHKVEFDSRKILNAVLRAYDSCEIEPGPYIRKKALDQDYFSDCKTVEDINDRVEQLLFTMAPKEVYDAFSKYRAMRAEMREKKKKKDIMSIVNVEINDITNDNANMNAMSPAGMMMKFAGEITKPFTKENFVAPDIMKAMDDNYIYIHDLDYYPTKSLTCVQTPLDKLLTQGLFAGHGEIRPAKRIETAVIVAAISMETTQNEQHGGQSIPAFDFYMAPYVRKTFEEEVDKIAETMDLGEEEIQELKNMKFKDYSEDAFEGRIEKLIMKRTINRVHQAMESFIHNCNNIHSRGGNQVVFSSINYGTDTSAEGRLVIRELLNCTMQGVGNGATAIFPIHVFKCKEGVNFHPDDPNYDLYRMAWPVTARRFFPNYLNLDAKYNQHPKWDENDPKRYEYEVATMGCRTRVWSNRFDEPGAIGRGNLSFTSINLPKIAIEVAIEDGFLKKTKDGYEIDPFATQHSYERILKFKSRLKKYADVVAKQLDDRYKFQATALKNQFPLLMSGVWKDSEKLGVGQTIEDVIKHGTLGVSFIGLAEALIALTGKHHGEDEVAQEYGLEIVRYLNELCKEYSDQYDHNYGCFATPAEGLSGRFTVVDRKQYGVIKHITDKDYYTNSSHVPVWYHCSPQHKAQIECPYHELEPAGHIFYVEADADITQNPDAVHTVNKIAFANGAGYVSINHTQRRCRDCNYETNDPGHRGDKCPKCGGTMSTLDRVTGYLSSTYEKQTFGKQAEIKDRVIHE